MRVAALTYAPSSAASSDARTASASRLGQSVLRDRMRTLLDVTVNPIISQPVGFAERLAAALWDAEAAIRVRRKYLGEDQTNDLLARVSALFDPEEWSEEDPIPSKLSIISTLRAVASIGGAPSLSISAAGNLTATWQDPDRSINVEGTPEGNITWACVIEGPSDFTLLGSQQGNLSEVLEAIRGH